jgi:hypothetical protein
MRDIARSPRISDHVQAQRYICDWLVRWQAVNPGRARAAVKFTQKISRCDVVVDIGPDHTITRYDLAAEPTEAVLHNLMLAAVEPVEAWKAPETRWKGAF